MIPSFLAAFFFALNATCASHSVRASGTVRANLGRLLVAAVVLGAIAHTAGRGFASASLGWFFLSGVIGMGLGDLGVYAALPLLGSRITVLMTQCLAAPIAALGEWLWLGTRLTTAQVLWGMLILVGVAVAITPSRKSPPKVRVRPVGFVFGVVAACGQGFGALVSRKGVDVAEEAGEVVHSAIFGLNAAYHRIVAGLVFTGLWFLALWWLGRLPEAPKEQAEAGSTPGGLMGRGETGEAGSAASRKGSKARRRRGWMIANGLAGPVMGVGCYQWALATTPSGIVLPIAATAPLLAIPIAFWLEGDRPPRRAIVGGVLAVVGCAALAVVK